MPNIDWISTDYPYRDDFGVFRCGIGQCPNCSRDNVMLIQYHHRMMIEGRVSGEIDVRSTILKAKRQPIGFTCGCYGRFHRQVGHIKCQMLKSEQKRIERRLMEQPH